MKMLYKLKSTFVAKLFIGLIVSTFIFLTACEKDQEIREESYFLIEGEPTNLSATTAGIIQKYVVRSNCNWAVVAQEDTLSWVKQFPEVGEDDGTFKLTVGENTTPYSRNAYFAFVADGEEQAILFTVEQEAAAPNLTFSDTLDVISNSWEIPGRENRFRVNIESNVDYRYSIADSWLSVVADSSYCLILEAAANPDNINSRMTTIDFVVDDFPSLSQTINIEQASFAPDIIISNTNSLNELDFEVEGGIITLDIDASVDWNYVLESNDWLSVIDQTTTSITLKATANASGKQRMLKLDFGFEEYDGGKQITVIQYAGVALLTENFDWVADISYDGVNASDIIYCYKTGPRYDYWEAAGVDMSAIKWTTTLINNTTSFYAQNGYVKLGKTKVGADIIFNKLAEIEDEVKLKVSFKSTAYVTANGNQNDERMLYVEALNDGITSVESFDIYNFPEQGNHTDPSTYNVVWNEDRTWEFVISKATSETQIRFLAGEAVGEMSSTNRISLDDIVISY